MFFPQKEESRRKICLDNIRFVMVFTRKCQNCKGNDAENFCLIRKCD